MDCFSKIKQKYENKTILILGLGIQGGSLWAVDFFHRLGATILVSDLKSKKQLSDSLKKLAKLSNIKYEFGKHSLSFVKQADVVVRNPGVNINSEILNQAKLLNKQVIMASSFFLKNCKAISIGITGTRGKSTTTNLIHQILKNGQKKPVYLAGNLPEYSAFKLIGKIKDKDFVVLELSSWDLQGFSQAKISPHIAILTNIYPDHLNFYKNMTDYINDKMQILVNQKQTDYFVTLTTTYKKYKKTIDNLLCSRLILVKPDYYEGDFKHLLGSHNRENASLALRVSELLKTESAKSHLAINNFQPLPFRLENIGTIKSATFYNDSTSTTPTAGIKGLTTIKEKYPKHQILLIAGGKEKNLPFETWQKTTKKIANQIFLLPGSFTDLVQKNFNKNNLVLANDIRQVFEKIIPTLNKETIVLFSPAATSFSTFNNEFHRGEEFNKVFNQFKNQYGA